MTRVTLHRVVRPAPGGRTRIVWTLRWFGTDGRRLGKTVGDTKAITKRDAEAARRELQAKLDCGVSKADKPVRMTLGAFKTMYLERRTSATGSLLSRQRRRSYPKLDPKTVQRHEMTLRYMVEHFGTEKTIDSVRDTEAERFIEAFEQGRLAGARKTEPQNGRMPSEGNIRARVRDAKAIFNWAKSFGYVRQNPFDDFDGRPLQSAEPHYVCLDDFEKLIAACGGGGLRSLVALCRLAGLRREEARVLPWAGKEMDSNGREHWVGIEWDTRRIHVVGREKARGTRRYRVVPMCPRLHDLLVEAFAAAPVGHGTACGLSPYNLRRNGVATARRAGLTPWPKFFQSLRSSCEIDWKTAGVAEATYCCWLGHSARVSRRHYVAPTDGEFEAITDPPGS